MPTVIKKDLANAIMHPAAILQRQAAAAVDALLKSLGDGNTVALRGFGTFKPQSVRARVARNPSRPDEIMNIPGRVVVKFKPSPRLRSKVAMIDPSTIGPTADGDLEEDEAE
jgi:nucleoid DNA-binding protein